MSNMSVGQASSIDMQLLQQTLQSGSNSKQAEANDRVSVYAKKGDINYQEEMDADTDGTITYKEYNEYCKQNASSTVPSSTKTVASKEEGSDTIKTIHVGRALNMYSQADLTQLQPKINAQA